MSATQIFSILMLFIVDLIFNVFGWSTVDCDTVDRPILRWLLIWADVVTVVALVLGAIGLFG